MAKLSYGDALQALNEEREVLATDVQAAALRRTVWFSCNGLPGCMPDSRGYSQTKEGAIESCLFVADDVDGPPRGMHSWLRRPGNRLFYVPGGSYYYEVSRTTLAQLL